MISLKEGGLFRSQQTLLGFVHWAHNIYRLGSLDRSSLSRNVEELSNLNEAKIFKFYIKSKLDLYGDILASTLSTLHAKGIAKCQIGNFQENHPLISSLESRFAGKHVHTITTLQKRNR